MGSSDLLSIPTIYKTMPLITFIMTLMCFTPTSLATQSEPEQVSLSNVNNFFTSEMVQKRFIVQSVIQFIILSLGWLASYEVWRSFNPDTSTDPDVDSLANFLLDDETAVGNVALGIGYAISSSIVWVALSQLGNPINSNRRRQIDNVSRSGVWNLINSDTLGSIQFPEKDVSITDDVLPSVFTRNNVLTQILINGVLTISFVSFWGFMDFIS